MGETSAPSTELKEFDVFLSFRGEDTRENFTAHLYEALVKNGIKTFMDNDALERGRDISLDLFEAIEKSKSVVVVFSEKYCDSSWCLNELAKIDESNEETGLKVFPVFCDVDPSHIRKQEGRVEKAFKKHEENLQNEMEKVESWRRALTRIANVSGWHMTDYRSQYPDYIRKITRQISENLYPKDIVGMDSRFRKFEPYLKRGSGEVQKVGIWGAGGIGKTTFAEEVFKRIRGDFQASHFVYRVREECETEDGLTRLKKDINDKLSNKKASMKVLIVLDDVDTATQVEDLVGQVGSGSKIFITTRDENLLKESGVAAVYEVEKLNDKEGLQLFSVKAFEGKPYPQRYYEELSTEYVNYAGGLPLALEVLGNYLRLHKSVKVWKGELKRLRETPHEGITRVLQFSYDALNYQAKETFLDIACFFKGEDESRLTKIFESCDFHPDSSLSVLVARSLIFFTGGIVWMHDLIQQMGWDIVRKDRISDPGLHSRLWRDRDALRVIQENMGTRVVQGIFLTSPRDHEEILSDPFVNMKSLRLLKICNVKFSESHEYDLSRELRLLEWHGYPLKSIVSSFQLERLVELSMPNSRLERLWKKTTHLENLMLINLSNCQNLIETPDFNSVPNLERLVLEGCKSLSKVHPSIAEHKQLAFLNLKDCENLEALPQRISLKCLATFILSGCSNLKEFPEIAGDMTKLSILYLDGTGIRELPTSINLLTGLAGLNLANCKNLLSLRSGIFGSLTSLKGLNLSGCVSMDQLPEDLGSLENLEHLFADGTPIRELPLSFVRLKCLKELSLRGCGLVQLPNDIGCLSLLQYLNLSENNFSSIPESISQLSELENLYLSKCGMLRSLPKRFPVNLRYMQARDCPMLSDCSKTEMTILTSNKGFQFIDCRNSSSVDEDSTMEAALPMPTEHVDLLFAKYIKGLINDGKKFEIRFPCITIPLWCTDWNKECPIKIDLSEDREDTGRITKGFALFVVFVIKELEHGNFDEELELKEIACHFYINKRPLEKTLNLANFKHFTFGSFGVCSYLPVEWFGVQLSTASSRVIEASFSTDRLDVELRMFGMRQVFKHEVKDFSEKLAQNANDHLDLEMNFDRHCQKLLQGANELADSGNITAVKHEGESSSRVPQNEAEQDHTVWDSIPSTEYKNFINETYSFLSVVFQGSFARHNCFHLLLPFPILSPWFFHHSVGNVAVCYLPPNIYEDERWLGLELYVECESRRSCIVGDSTIEVYDLNIDLYAHGKSMLPIFSHEIKIPTNSRFVTIHVPQRYFSEKLNNSEGISAIFQPSTRAVEVKMCGTRLLYEHESKLISKGIIQCIFQKPFLLRFLHEAAIGLLQSGQSDDVESNIALRREMPQSSRLPTYEPRERNILKSSQNFLTSTEQPAMEVSTSIDKYRREYAERQVFDDPDTFIVHSKQSFLKNWENMQEDTSCMSSVTFNHLHIMAESILHASNSQNQIETLKVLLREFFKHRVLVTLSLKGHIIFALKHFAPGSPYNLCFPQKRIPKWFDDHHHNDSMVGIRLPPNLRDDNSWRGLAICACFSVKENPDIFSKGSFRVLCHLASEGTCLNAVASCSVTRDKIKWLYVRGFIWLAYIPNVMLAELNGKISVEARIYSHYPGLIVDKCGIRLLYENDVEELNQIIIQCCSSFIEDWDLMDEFVANVDEVKDFGDKLARNANDHLDLKMNFDQHCQKLLEGANELAESGNIKAVKHEGESSLGVPQNEAEQDQTVWDSIPSIEYKNFINETYSLLSVVFQGRFARHNCFHLVFPFGTLLPLFFHHSVGNVTVCYLPPNTYKDERWLGLELYAECEPFQSDSVADLASKGVFLDIALYAHGKSMLPIFTHKINIPINGFVAIHVPFKHFPEDLNNYKGISATFEPSTPDVEVKMCGTRLLYEDDSKLISKGIMESIFQMPDVVRFVHVVVTRLLENYQSDDDKSDIAFKRKMPQSSCMTPYEPREWNLIKSLQKLLTSTEQLAREVSTSIGEYRREYVERPAFIDTELFAVNSKHSFFKNSENIQEDTLGESFGTFNHLHMMAETTFIQEYTLSQLSGIFNHFAESHFKQDDILSGLPSTFNHSHIMAESNFKHLHTMAESTFNHLHIMAESILHANHSQKRITTLKILLRQFFKHRVLVTLSLKGHMVFALEHFVPSSPYNLCFPQKGIPKWFDDHHHNDSVAGIRLPPNLHHDKSWRGLVICACFSVKENPDAFSTGSFRILCHLASEGICLNPATSCSVIRDKIKWLYVHGFIWLAYIPSVMLAELDGKISMEAKIYSHCPDLIVEECGIRLLYENDVKQLEQVIIQCCTSFVEDWDLMDKFVANEDDE